jgi:hypothetical protein
MPRKKKSLDYSHIPPESPTSPVQAITPVSGPVTYTATESDTYARIAAEFLRQPFTKHQYAVYLAEKNKNKVIREGTVIEL